VQRKGFRCTFLSQHAPGVDGGVERIQYLIQGGATPQTHYCSASFENATWHSHAIPYPTGDGSIAYDLGRHLYTFNPKSLAWDHLDVSAIPDVAGEAPKDGAQPGTPNSR
jgi:hypothetical protein